jgi:hypothetical protein
MKWLRKLNVPLPGWLTLLLFSGALAAQAAGALPFFASGTASYGPGGNIDLGSVNASMTSPGPSDPQLYAGSGGNAALLAPNGQYVNLVNCLTAACNDANKQITLQAGATQVTSLVPVYALPVAPTGSPPSQAGPVAPCYEAANATPCPNGWHVLVGTTTLNNSGSANTCPANSVCALATPGSVATFNPGNSYYASTPFACYASNNDITYNTQTEVQWINVGKVQFEMVNPNPTALPTPYSQNVGWTCVWY